MLTGKMRAALVTVMVEARDWNPRACAEAIDRMDATGRFNHQAYYANVVGRYVSALTEDARPRYTTPALLADEGEHWTHTPIEGRKARTLCTTHGQPYPCQDCIDDPDLKPLTHPSEWRAQVRIEADKHREARRAEQAEQQARRDAAHTNQKEKP